MLNWSRFIKANNVAITGVIVSAAVLFSSEDERPATFCVAPTAKIVLPCAANRRTCVDGKQILNSDLFNQLLRLHQERMPRRTRFLPYTNRLTRALHRPGQITDDFVAFAAVELRKGYIKMIGRKHTLSHLENLHL